MVENLHAPMVATMLSNAFSFEMFFLSVFWKNFWGFFQDLKK
jgi:hypothetical protein